MFSEQKKGWAVAIAPLTSPGANLQLGRECGVGVGAPRSGSIPLSQRLPRPGSVGSRTKGISGAERRGVSLGWRRGAGLNSAERAGLNPAERAGLGGAQSLEAALHEGWGWRRGQNSGSVRPGGTKGWEASGWRGAMGGPRTGRPI